MRYLPWSICENDPSLVIDAGGCVAIDLSVWGALGKGHDAKEVVAFIVERANREHVTDEEQRLKDEFQKEEVDEDLPTEIL
tara:strand:- start:14818 stop:15060 length:243 start_codon:yes stop_codon:yes gene_type:complete